MIIHQLTRYGWEKIKVKVKAKKKPKLALAAKSVDPEEKFGQTEDPRDAEIFRFQEEVKKAGIRMCELGKMIDDLLANQESAAKAYKAGADEKDKKIKDLNECIAILNEHRNGLPIVRIGGQFFRQEKLSLYEAAMQIIDVATREKACDAASKAVRAQDYNMIARISDRVEEILKLQGDQK